MTPLPASPTPPDAPTPEEIADQRAFSALDQRLRAEANWLGNALAHVEPCDYYREVEKVSGILVDFDPNTRHESISAHVASLLRAYEGMRADAERLDWLEANQIDVIYGDPLQDLAGGWICYAHGLPEPPDGSDPRPTAREAIDAARASAPNSEAENG